MTVDIYNFRRYRNVHCLIHAMLQFCRATVGKGGAKGHCPRQSCFHKGYNTLKCSNGSTVAYCHACHTSFDALQIVAESQNIGLRAACEVLELFGEDA